MKIAGRIRDMSCERRAKRTSQVIVKLRGGQSDSKKCRLDLEKGQKSAMD